MKVFSLAIVERAYNPHSAAAKQKCFTHLERDSRSANGSVVLRVIGPRASAVGEILTTARTIVSRRVEALLLSQIYPFENYLAADGKPDVKIRNGRLSHKATKRHLSLRRFSKALGYAPSHSWQRRNQQVESQRRLRFMSESLVAVDIYQD